MAPNTRDSGSIFKSLDWFTVALYLIMVLAGVMSIYAASYDFDNASVLSFAEFSGKQVRWIGMSLFLGFIILLVNSRLYETYAFPVYILLLGLLFITPFVAPDIKGSRSWLVFGPMSLQPAEFAKFATALALAKLFSEYGFSLNAKPSNYFKALAIIFIPIFLILLQKETGSALTFLALFFVLYREGMSGFVLFSALMAVITFVIGLKYYENGPLNMPLGHLWIYILTMGSMIGMVYCLKSNRKYIIGRNLLCWFSGTGLLLWLLSGVFGVSLKGTPILIGILCIAFVYLIFEGIKTRFYKFLLPIVFAFGTLLFLYSIGFAFNHLQPHQQQRIKVVLGIEEDLQGAGYNVNQSIIAIGSGGLTGKGFLNGTQTKLKYVPEQHTDFIFCTIGEEQGFLGTSAVMLLFILLILRVIKIAERQPTTFGRVYGYCVASYLIFHFCINIGMVIGLCPVIGIPLPFFSYGGSSLWGFTILLFILLRIDAGRKQVLTY